MERQQWPDLENTSTNGLGAQVSAYLSPVDNLASGAFSPRRRRGDAAKSGDSSPILADEANERITRLSLNEFCERIVLLAELELPCSVHIANPSAEQISRGVVRRIERDADRLNLLGDGFSLHLHRDNIDSIWLVTGSGGDEQGMAIEIHNRSGSLIARLFGMQDSVGAAVWRDVMGNPSFAVA